MSARARTTWWWGRYTISPGSGGWWSATLNRSAATLPRSAGGTQHGQWHLRHGQRRGQQHGQRGLPPSAGGVTTRPAATPPVSGGIHNTASGEASAVSGGITTRPAADASSVSGGMGTSPAATSAVSGGGQHPFIHRGGEEHSQRYCLVSQWRARQHGQRRGFRRQRRPQPDGGRRLRLGRRHPLRRRVGARGSDALDR